MAIDPYALLGVSPDASAAAIRRAYLREAKRRHPDLTGSDAEMALLNRAYELVSASGRKARPVAPRVHEAPRRAHPMAYGGAALPARAAQFVEAVVMPLDRLLALALDRLPEAIAAGELAVATEQALLALEATGSRLARADWPAGLEAVRARYGQGLRQVSDALLELAADDAEAARLRLAAGRALLREALFRAT